MGLRFLTSFAAMAAVIVFALLTPYTLEVKVLIVLMSVTLVIGGIGSLFTLYFGLPRHVVYRDRSDYRANHFRHFGVHFSDCKTGHPRRHCDRYRRLCQPDAKFRKQSSNSLLQAQLQTNIRPCNSDTGRVVRARTSARAHMATNRHHHDLTFVEQDAGSTRLRSTI